ncbi:MAG: class I tRNA ligase family protein [Phycisphaerales bacterium]|nr:class I tRNA ligase family protein [Phycisphaerales bacterium]
MTRRGEPLTGTVYAHSWWVREGQKMSKSLGNFLDFPTLRAYADAFSVDALRWFLATQGPLGATDADFAHARFVEAYNADLANGVGNAASRVANMIDRYFEGACPDPRGATSHAGHDWPAIAGAAVENAVARFHAHDLAGAMEAGLALVRRVDGYINATEPFKIAKDPARRDELGVILYHCAEAIRIAALILSAAMPVKMADLLARMGAPDLSASRLDRDGAWGGLRPGVKVVKGDALFPRADADAPAPQPVGGED